MLDLMAALDLPVLLVGGKWLEHAESYLPWPLCATGGLLCALA